MTIIVVDASVALKWLLPEPDSSLAIKLLAHEIIAPELLHLECANVLRRYQQRNSFSADMAQAALQDLLAVEITVIPTLSVICEALDFAIMLNHPVYNCQYLAIAAKQKLPLITADEHFWLKIQHYPQLMPLVKKLGDPL